MALLPRDRTSERASGAQNLTFQIERFTDALMEGRRHADAHWLEFGLRKELRQFNMDWDKYLAADAANRLMLVTARRGGLIVGYLVMLTASDPHAKGGWMAQSGFFYTIPHPMRGLLLRGMIRKACNTLLDNGVTYIRFSHRLQQTARPIVENLGFVLDELSYSLDLSKFRRR